MKKLGFALCLVAALGLVGCSSSDRRSTEGEPTIELMDGGDDTTTVADAGTVATPDAGTTTTPSDCMGPFPVPMVMGEPPCSAAAWTALQTCADQACVEGVFEGETEDCSICANFQNPLSCANSMGCQDRWDAFSCCLEDNCPDGSCAQTTCGSQLSAVQTCVQGVGRACLPAVQACFAS